MFEVEGDHFFLMPYLALRFLTPRISGVLAYVSSVGSTARTSSCLPKTKLVFSAGSLPYGMALTDLFF